MQIKQGGKVTQKNTYFTESRSLLSPNKNMVLTPHILVKLMEFVSSKFSYIYLV